MFCDHCGKEAGSDARFCSNCGRAFAAVGAAPNAPAGATTYAYAAPQSRVNSHVRTLGILWLICGVLRAFNVMALWMVGRVIIPSVFSNVTGFAYSSPLEHLIRGGIAIASGILVFQTVLALLAGWGLLERQSWGRIVGIVAGAFALLRIPFGTALGIYTLWVLLPANSEIEYRSMVRA